MPTSPSDERSRAEARRRARRAARGELPETNDEAAEPAPEAERPRGLLRTLFPPAPPLPGRPDPLAGFDPDGPLRPVRERWFLLRTSPLVWILPGIVTVIGYVASRFYARNFLGLLGMFVLFGALIAAGWFGWRRPALYGTAAGFVGFLLATALVLWFFAGMGAPPQTFSTSVLLVSLAVEALYLIGLGFLGGWYGGYLRRRQAAIAPTSARRRR